MTEHPILVVLSVVVNVALSIWFMRHRPIVEIVYIAVLALLAFQSARNAGIPVWRDEPVGDATDIGSLVFAALCFVRGAR